MSNRILAVTADLELADLCRSTNPDFEVTVIATADEALATLARQDGFDVLLAHDDLPDMAIEPFLEQALGLCSIIPVLAAEGNDLAALLNMVNRLNIFRLLPLPTSVAQLETALYDGSCQAVLIRREKHLRRKLHHLASLDPLTECFKRRIIEERLPIELKRSVRYAHHLSLILCDIDNLGEINRQYGHRIGDRILTGVAQAGREIFRLDVDWISRWDEDAFLILLPETPIRGAAVVAERLRRAVNELEIETDSGPVRTTISAGLTGYAPDSPARNADMEDILLVAGNCLNQAKEDGGNKVLICP